MANCKIKKKQRRELEKALHRGEKLTLADLLRRQGSMSSIDSEKGLAAAEWHGGHY